MYCRVYKCLYSIIFDRIASVVWVALENHVVDNFDTIQSMPAKYMCIDYDRDASILLLLFFILL